MIWHFMKKDFRRALKNPLGFFVLLSLPLVFTLLLGLVFGPSDGKQVLPPIKMLIEDRDSSFVSQLFGGAFGYGPLASMYQVIHVAEGQGRELMDKDKASALLIIPENFGSDVLEGRPTELVLVKNPSEQFLPDIAEETVNILGEAIERIYRIAQAPIDSIRKYVETNAVPTDEEVAAISIVFRHLFESAGDLLFPPIISIKEESVSAAPKKGHVNVFAYLLVGITVMSLLFVLDGLARDLFREHENRTLYRILTGPTSLKKFISAKMLYIALMGFLVQLLVWIVGGLVFRVHFSPGQVVRFVLFSAVLLPALTGIVALIYSLARTRAQASGIAPIFIIVFSMMGGSMIPFPSLPAFVQKVAVISPVYWGVDGLQKIIIEAASLVSVTRHIVVLLSIAVSLNVLSFLFFERRFRR